MTQRAEAGSSAERAAARRLGRELRTVEAMIAMHCHDRHQTKRGLCDECAGLWAYVQQRVARCPFLTDKPTCLNCTVHCFKPAAREEIRAIMRYAGPRMLWRHPILTLFHIVDGRRPAPEKPRRTVDTARPPGGP